MLEMMDTCICRSLLRLNRNGPIRAKLCSPSTTCLEGRRDIINPHSSSFAMVAKTGKDAIHIAETFDGQIDLALLDIKLPDIDGRNLYPLIMKARPDLKVIVFSGYAIEGPAREILDAGAQDFIQKPFSIATLSEKLKEVSEGK